MRLSLKKLLQLSVLLCCILFLHIYYVRYQKFESQPDANNFGDALEYKDGGNAFVGPRRVDTGDIKGPYIDDSVRLRPKRNVKVYPGPGDNVNTDEFAKSGPGQIIAKLPPVKTKQSTSVPVKKKLPAETYRQTELQDIFISVKTTQKFHRQRLQLLLDTWVPLARKQTFFFTDADDKEYQEKTNGQLITTNCSSIHSRHALCCKMGLEFDYFIQSNKRWFCHVDDDTYVNVAALINLVRRYNHTKDWYLGKPSLNHPIEISNSDSPGTKVSFWFATGGAGMCISRSLAEKMIPFAGGGRLVTQGNKIRLPDDCTIGYVIYYYLHKKLTIVEEFHSHLEGLWVIRPENLHKQITFSYMDRSDRKKNVVEIEGFDNTSDPTRFHSIHCHLFPQTKGCETVTRRRRKKR